MRVLVRLPNWLGDALLARPLLHALARLAPPAETVAVGPGPLVALLASDGAFGRGVAWPGARGERAAALAELRRWRPDAALVLPPSFSSAWLAWRSGAPRRIGFAADARSWLLTEAPRRLPRGDLHLSREYAGLGRSLGVAEDAPAPPRLTLPPAAASAAAAALAAAGVPAGDSLPLALLGPGAIYGPAKRWPADRFAALAARLADGGFRVLVCGTAAERDACERVAGGRHAVLAGRTDLLAQAGLCARAALAVCNDSGLAHLAAACGAPTVAVFGSTSSAWTAPLGERVRVVQRPPVCAPCFRPDCRIGYECLQRVEVERVWSACRELAA